MSEQWEKETLDPVIKKYPERKKTFILPSDILVPRVALPEEQDFLEDVGFPGQFPFTRGVQPTMYRGRFWTMRQYAGYATAEKSNRRYRFLLDQGQTGLSVAFDLPTQIGYDSDDPLAEGEVGKVGVAISSLRDMEKLFDGIPLDRVSTSMTINSPAAILLAMVIAIAQKRGIDERKLRGTIQNDILKEYIARGTYIFPPKPSMRLITDVFQYCQTNIPNWNSISISGYHIREAGATAVQELAFTFINAIAYVEAAVNAGLKVDNFAAQLSFFFACHNNFLEEIAKFRAARRIWARLMRDRFGAKNARSQMMRFHTQTAGSTLTAQQPENNIVRTTLQALAAVLGGTQSLHTNSMDEALTLPSEKAVQIALRTQQIIAYEAGVADTVDPLAGSYYIEHLTNEIEKSVNVYIARVDEMGGALEAIENGYIQREIQESAYRYQKAVEAGKEIIVGVNAFNMDEDAELEVLKVNPALETSRREELSHLRKKRDQDTVRRLLTRLENAAESDENLMPHFIECVKHDITLGEICGTLRRVWGEYQPPVWG
ncbi:MAG: methylmalonyl-CoA mutase family protein [Anaerolineaceae bacterium]|nr:methylmalonyl-CoA mutase family protein [Anaerolineaceae bacterium]